MELRIRIHLALYLLICLLYSKTLDYILKNYINPFANWYVTPLSSRNFVKNVMLVVAWKLSALVSLLGGHVAGGRRGQQEPADP